MTIRLAVGCLALAFMTAGCARHDAAFQPASGQTGGVQYTGLRAELEFLPPLPAGLDRRELASRAEHDLACALGLSIGSASADTSTSTPSPEASSADGLAS